MPGPPSRLTAQVHQRICDSIEAGNSETVAAEAAGLTRRTVQKYLGWGRTAFAATEAWLTDNAEDVAVLEAHYPGRDEFDGILLRLAEIAEREWPFWLLLRDVTRSRARNAEREMLMVTEAAAGYEWTETTVVERQVIGRDGLTTTLTTRTTVTKRNRDWRAAAWKLEHSPGLKDDYVKGAAVATVAITGADGGPVVVEGAETNEEAIDQLRREALRLIHGGSTDGQVEEAG